jgi:hypothetical protein
MNAITELPRFSAKWQCGSRGVREPLLEERKTLRAKLRVVLAGRSNTGANGTSRNHGIFPARLNHFDYRGVVEEAPAVGRRGRAVQRRGKALRTGRVTPRGGAPPLGSGEGRGGDYFFGAFSAAFSAAFSGAFAFSAVLSGAFSPASLRAVLMIFLNLANGWAPLMK